MFLLLYFYKYLNLIYLLYLLFLFSIFIKKWKMEVENNYKIYGLKSKKENIIRYVGYTKLNLKKNWWT